MIYNNGYVWYVGMVQLRRVAANDMWGWQMVIVFDPLAPMRFVGARANG